MIRRYHLQLPFWLYCGMCLLVASAAYTSGNNLLYWIFGVLLAGLLISGLVSGLMMMRLRVIRVSPAQGVVGQPLIVRYAVTNRSRVLPAFNLHLEELTAEESLRLRRRWLRRRGPDATSETATDSSGAPWQTIMDRAHAWVMHIAPRETVHGEAVFWPQHRGEARFDALRVWTTFPFGIIRKSITVGQTMYTLVFPRVYELKQQVRHSMLPRGPLGSAYTGRAGVGDEYFGLRDYRPGDSLRHIAWKRAAGLDQVVAIQRSQVSPPRLRVVLDLSRPTHQLQVEAGEPVSARALEERAISLAASLLHAAASEGFDVGVTVLGYDVPAAPLRRNQWHLQKLMANLAGLDLNRERQGTPAPGAPDAERAAQVVVHPDRIDPSLGQRDGWHVSARQLENLVDGPLDGLDPTNLSAPPRLPAGSFWRRAWSRLLGTAVREAAA